MDLTLDPILGTEMFDFVTALSARQLPGTAAVCREIVLHCWLHRALNASLQKKSISQYRYYAVHSALQELKLITR